MLSPPAGRLRPKGRVELLMIGAVFLVGLASSLVWLATAQRAWPGVMFERRVLMEEPMTAETPVQVWDRIRGLEAGRLSGPHVHLPGLAAQLALQMGELDEPRRKEVFEQGRSQTRLALAREPAAAHAWARLATYRMSAGGPSEAVVAALRMSIYAAPAMKSLVFWRIRMAGLCRAHWDPEFENLIRRQIVLGRRISAQKLAATVAGSHLEALSRQVSDEIGETLKR
jgi:hypothetical protein